MTREQMLDLLMLLAALESWAFSLQKPLPDHLQDQISACVDVMRAVVMGDGK